MKIIKISISFVLLMIQFPSRADLKHDTLSVYFGKNKSEISSLAEEKLLQIQDIEKIELIGYSDPDGKSALNIALSLKRAETIKNFFISKGVKEDNIRISRNDNKVQKLNLSNIDKAILRKVDIFITYTIPKFHKKKSQVLFINPQKDTILTGQEGTLIEFKNSALNLTNSEPVRLELTEYLNTYDILTNNLFTIADGNLLESAGMININFYDSNENKLELNSESSLIVRFPNKNNLNPRGFEEFYGEINDSTKIINWKQDLDTISVTFAETLPIPVIGMDSLRKKIKTELEIRRIKYNDLPEFKVLILKNGTIHSVEHEFPIVDTINLKSIILEILKTSTEWIPASFQGISYPMFLQESLILHEMKIPTKVEIPKTNFKEISSTKSEKYINLKIEKLGYINCDRFVGKGLFNFSIEMPLDSNYVLKVIVKKYMSLFPEMYKEIYNSTIITNFLLPYNLPILIYAEKKVNNKTYFTIYETETTSKIVRLKNFSELNEEGNKRLIEILKR